MKVLSTVDDLVLADVYPAGEAPIVGADGRALARSLRLAGKVEPVFVEKSAENGSRLVDGLRELGFELSQEQGEEIQRGKDFVQLKNGPFDVDLVFAPDGIETFEDAWRRHVEVEGFPVCHLDDIIASKAAANRVRDRETLPRLLAFRDYWLRQRR